MKIDVVSATALTGADLIEKWISSGPHDPHARLRHCPVCGEDLAVQALTKLAYVFAVCACGTPDYEHLVEQLWHLECLRAESKQAASVA